MNGPQPRLRRREIRADDLEGVIDLLRRGFPARPRAYWGRGLRRMGERPPVAGCPRYGFLIEDGGRTVGAVLTLGSADREGRVRCNLSSWAVDPAYRVHGALLVASALRREAVTFTNLSAAPHTRATIEAQGFTPYAEGESLVLPWLGRPGTRARVSEDPAAWRALPEAALLDDHAAYGCACLTVEAGGILHPFVLSRVRAGGGRWPLPLARLVFCRDAADVARFAGAIGRWALRHGAAGVLVDGDPPAGMPGLRGFRRGRKYFRGPHPPRAGDLSYSEVALFGP